jgi:Protein of unknown function (DUF3563)
MNRKTMSKIHALLMSLMPQWRGQQMLDEQYLAESVDTADLERRMREIDHRAFQRSSDLAVGLYTR